jgi:hypothetical protein
MKTVIFPMIEAVKRKGQVQRNSEHLRSDGSLFPTQTKMILLKNETDKTVGIIIFVIDITQYIQRENLLASNVSRSRSKHESTRRSLSSSLTSVSRLKKNSRDAVTSFRAKLKI